MFRAMISRPENLTQQRLRYNVLLETLTDEEFNLLQPRLRPREYASGDIIIEDETHGEEMHFLLQGRVRIVKTNLEGKEHVLAILHPGDCFGELELIAGRPRSARVVAADRVMTCALERKDFEELLSRSPALALRLLQVLSIRVRALNYHFMRETNRKIGHEQKEFRKLEQLIDASKKLNSTLNLEELLDIILEMALQMVDGDRGTVYLLDEAKQELWTKVSRELGGTGRVTICLPVGKGIAGYVAATGDAINIPDAYLDPRFNPEFDRRTGYRTQSILCVPMRNKDNRIIGVFQLLNKRNGLFTDEDVRYIEALSVHASLAIEKARLYEQEREKIRIERDLGAARLVQMSLLPKRLPEVPGYEFSATTLPAREVAGDLYDFLTLEGGKIAFCLGDVSGKGLPASLLMANIQATIRDQARMSAGAAECVNRTNKLMAQTILSEKFVTLFYGVLSPGSGDLCYSNAGHDHPFLVSHDGSARRLDVGGVVVGILEEFPFDQEVVPFRPGDVLVVYSDGIAEALNSAGEQFGEEGIGGVVRGHRTKSAVDIQAALLASVREHTGDAPLLDDMTLLVVKRL